MTPEERIEAVRRAVTAEATRQSKIEEYDTPFFVPADPQRPDNGLVVMNGLFNIEGFAQAAITATLQSLLEPSDAMAMAAYEAPPGIECPSPHEAWPLMIHAAIKEHQ